MLDPDRLQSLWAQQTQEPFAMSLADVRARAESFQARIRRRNRLEYVAAVFVISIYAYLAYEAAAPLMSLSVGLIIAGLLYVLWRLTRIAGSAPKEASVSWTDFHRAELARQRDALRNVWRWYLAPLVPGLVAFNFVLAFAPQVDQPLAIRIVTALVGIGLVAFGFFSIAAMNARAAKRLDAEIEALDQLRSNQR